MTDQSESSMSNSADYDFLVPIKDHNESSSVCNSSSILTGFQVSLLMHFANISPSDFEYLVPGKDDRANSPPEGYISVYKEQIVNGLRFPLHELVLQVCNRIKVSPGQLRPDAVCKIVGFILFAKLWNVPITADCFFSNAPLMSLQPGPGLTSVEADFCPPRWKREFFFLRPVGKSWNCITKWSQTLLKPQIDDAVKSSYKALGLKSGMFKHRFWLPALMKRDVLVHAGIEPGDPSPRFTFRYLMHRAAMTKFKLVPEDALPANVTDKTANKRPLSAAPSASKVAPNPINQASSSPSKDIEELLGEQEENHSAPHKKRNHSVLVSADKVQQQSLPDPLDAISKTLESIFVPKDCYEKLEKEKQAVMSELTLTKSRVQELQQEIELYKAKKVESEHRTVKANVNVKILEKRLENLKSESECLRDKIKKDAIDEFKSSDDFSNAVHEEATKYYINGFETCKLQILNSGKLPIGFNLDVLDVADADAELGSSSRPVSKTAVDPHKKSFKRKKSSKPR